MLSALPGYIYIYVSQRTTTLSTEKDDIHIVLSNMWEGTSKDTDKKEKRKSWHEKSGE